MVLAAGVEVIQEYAIKMPILTLTISNWTDYFKVEMSHYVRRLIMYRPTLLPGILHPSPIPTVRPRRRVS